MPQLKLNLYCPECGDTDVDFDKENFIVKCTHGCGETHQICITHKQIFITDPK